ncbi:RHS repeat domain-containing protein [Flavobacterium sp. SUN046]|uniref:RHS repeat domain-containing protein n=1 Tax=Flavobacterium sp. SUN046 TaxID=3002440 RepID=UPI002DB5CD5A|nr:RHS repeat-associated core domain-containing protein [Flavobacterium sp. SUN046]
MTTIYTQTQSYCQTIAKVKEQVRCYVDLGFNRQPIWWYHPDHLGSSSYLTDFSGIPSHYYDYLPFGEEMVSQNTSVYNNFYKFSGKELDEDTGLYYFGARYYDPKWSVWLSVDAMAEKYPNAGGYNYCLGNPLNMVDPDGMSVEPPSTHTDEKGNVIAVFNDGDNGIYKHKANADGGTPTQYMLSKRQETLGKSAGGEKVGETWTPLGFADFDAYKKDGTVKPATGATIDFESNWANDKVKDILSRNPSLTEYADKTRSGHVWDIKKDAPNENIYYGSNLFGKYASARDAGNFTAGAVAQMQVLIPNAVPDYGFGVYNQSGNNPMKALILMYLQWKNPIENWNSIKNSAINEEHPLSKAGIEAGKTFIKSIQK